MNKQEIKELLQDVPCVVTFTKVSGEERVMECTLNQSLIPQVEVVSGAPKRAPRTESEKVLAVWDLSKEDWRSFRVESVIKIESEVGSPSGPVTMYEANISD